jgi:phosphoribosylformimino-5-aminoimidazole carboxamide ribotide isomerase
MIVMPAVDLREGACVQLVGGDYEQERVRLPDPVGVARQWAAVGFRFLHLVDLDAATGRGSNTATLRAIAGEPGLEIQVGGGVRDDDTIAQLLGDGARRIVVGTRALEEPEWLAAITDRWPDRIVVAADVRDGFVVTRGWRRTLSHSALDVVRTLNQYQLAAVLVTAVHLEGRLGGTDLPLMAGVASVSRAPVYASGGIASLQDLRALAAGGIAGAVVGMALYTGVLDAGAVAQEFGA